MEDPKPKRSRSNRPPRAKSGPYVRARVVLVVDDWDDNLELYSAALTCEGFHVITASDGAEAIVKALARHPDAIVMDVSMPNMDGIEATRRLKSHTDTRNIPIVVLTGNGVQGHAAATAAGCDAYLVKPCMTTDLVVVLDSLIATARVRSGRRG